MKCMSAILAGLVLLLILNGCNNGDSTGTTITKIVNAYQIVDTLAVDTINTSTLLSFDTSSADTVRISLKNSALLLDHIYYIKTTIFDTLFKHYARVDSSIFKYNIYSMSIVDTANIASDTVISDTLDTVLVDSLTELFITVNYLDSLDKMTSVKERYDSLPFPNCYLVGSTSDQNTGSIGYGSLYSYITDTTYTGNANSVTVFKVNSMFTRNSSVYVLEGTGADNIIRFDGPEISNTTKVYSANLGASVDIHDISFSDNSKAYITRYLDSMVVVFDIQRGIIIDSINLSRYGLKTATDTMNVPYMHKSICIDDKLFILLKRLHSNQGNPVPDTAIGGLVVVLSTDRDSVLDTISLAMKNPLAMEYFDGCLYVLSTGLLASATDGGIEKIDISTYTNHGKICSESKFGGNISDFVLVSQTKGYIRVSLQAREALFEFNPLTGASGNQLPIIENVCGDIVFDGLYVYVCDNRTVNPGIVIFDPNDNNIIGKPISFGTGLPVSVALVKLKNR